jgi:hypothetical protein
LSSNHHEKKLTCILLEKKIPNEKLNQIKNLCHNDLLSLIVKIETRPGHEGWKEEEKSDLKSFFIEISLYHTFGR